MLHKTRGIVLKTTKYGETSVIAKVYTEHLGLQSYIINAVRTAKSKNKASYLQPLSLLELVVYYKENRDLNRISEMKPAFLFRSIPFDVVKSAVAMFMVELLSKAIREEEQNEQQFEFLFRLISFLDETQSPVGNFHLYFLIHFSRYLGFYPQGSFSPTTTIVDLKEGSFTQHQPSHLHFVANQLAEKMGALMHSSLAQSYKISFTRNERRELLDKLVEFYKLHLEHFTPMKSVDILEEVLA